MTSQALNTESNVRRGVGSVRTAGRVRGLSAIVFFSHPTSGEMRTCKPVFRKDDRNVLPQCSGILGN